VNRYRAGGKALGGALKFLQLPPIEQDEGSLELPADAHEKPD